MKTIRLLRSTAIRGNAYGEGMVLEVDDGDARILIDMGRAKLEDTTPPLPPQPLAVGEVNEEAEEPKQKPRRSKGKAE